MIIIKEIITVDTSKKTYAVHTTNAIFININSNMNKKNEKREDDDNTNGFIQVLTLHTVC